MEVGPIREVPLELAVYDIRLHNQRHAALSYRSKGPIRELKRKRLETTDDSATTFNRNAKLEASVRVRSDRCLMALDPLGFLLERVHSRCGCRGAVGLPLLVFLLVSRPVGRASPIRSDIESLHAPDAEIVQASLREKVLAHGSILALFDAELPIDLLRGFASVDVLKQCAEGNA